LIALHVTTGSLLTDERLTDYAPAVTGRSVGLRHDGRPDLMRILVIFARPPSENYAATLLHGLVATLEAGGRAINRCDL
jgi:hypothetical protein